MTTRTSPGYSANLKARDARMDRARKGPAMVRCSACEGHGFYITESLGAHGGPTDVTCDECHGTGRTEGLPDGSLEGMLAASVGLAKAGVRRFGAGGGR